MIYQETVSHPDWVGKKGINPMPDQIVRCYQCVKDKAEGGGKFCSQNPFANSAIAIGNELEGGSARLGSIADCPNSVPVLR